MSGRERAALWLILAGFIVWSVGFVLLYGLQALGCEYGWDKHRQWLILAYGLVVLALGWIAWHTQKVRTGSGLGTTALWANRAALGAGLLTFLPVTFASTCI
jgi:hypothetical protein